MDFPFSLYGDKYFENLRAFREAALNNSHWHGRRKRLGGFTYGIAHAEWQTEEGGWAHLIDEGLRYKNTTMSKLKPTTLRLYSQHGGGFEMVTFEMDIDDIGFIGVYRNMITSGSFREILRMQALKRRDKKHAFHESMSEDREMLYTEMQRGATGLYAVMFDYEADE